jgi:hypothetical protein
MGDAIGVKPLKTLQNALAAGVSGCCDCISENPRLGRGFKKAYGYTT